jgi:D-proline reductase (dithiol) PrdB
VTTAGVHLKAQRPFDMEDPEGDPSYRVIPAEVSPASLTITHDYYDHRDADKDINIVLPITRLGELAAAGVIGAVAPSHYSFMGHIDGAKLATLVHETAPRLGESLRGEGVDAVFLTPA